jgi:hypothetical protein
MASLRVVRRAVLATVVSGATVVGLAAAAGGIGDAVGRDRGIVGNGMGAWRGAM